MFLALDMPALLSGLLAAVTCALIGNFLLLRGQAMLSDAISHSVFPGIVGAYLLLSSTSVWVMLGGSLAAAMLSVFFIHLASRVLESETAIGLVFTAMFAIGVLLLEQGSRSVHLDVEDALYGYMEGTIWPELAKEPPLSLGLLLDMPYELGLLFATFLAAVGLLTFSHRQLLATTFDEDFAHTIGIRNPSLPLLALTCLAAVAGFNAVGAVLIIAMFVCPSAAAICLSDRFATRLYLSVGFAITAVLVGYAAAIFAPLFLPVEHSLSAAGCIALLMAIIQLLAMLKRRSVAATMRRHASASASSSNA